MCERISEDFDGGGLTLDKMGEWSSRLMPVIHGVWIAVMIYIMLSSVTVKSSYIS